MACLGLEWAELPEGDWECPKCSDRKDAAVRRLLDFELRKVEAFEKCVSPLQPPLPLFLEYAPLAA